MSGHGNCGGISFGVEILIAQVGDRIVEVAAVGGEEIAAEGVDVYRSTLAKEFWSLSYCLEIYPAIPMDIGNRLISRIKIGNCNDCTLKLKLTQTILQQ
jgi:hypothetical protein